MPKSSSKKSKRIPKYYIVMLLAIVIIIGIVVVIVIINSSRVSQARLDVLTRINVIKLDDVIAYQSLEDHGCSQGYAGFTKTNISCSFSVTKAYLISDSFNDKAQKIDTDLLSNGWHYSNLYDDIAVGALGRFIDTPNASYSVEYLKPGLGSLYITAYKNDSDNILTGALYPAIKKLQGELKPSEYLYVISTTGGYEPVQ